MLPENAVENSRIVNQSERRREYFPVPFIHAGYTLFLRCSTYIVVCLFVCFVCVYVIYVGFEFGDV